MNHPTTVDGCRLYPTPRGDRAPSVTTILSKTSSWKEKKALENWGKKNPGGADAAAAKGSYFHLLAEQWLRHGRVLEKVEEEDEARFSILREKVLKRFVKLDWIEGSLHRPVTSVFSDWGYAGKPDWAGTFNDPEVGPVPVLLDLKTSKQPYCAFQPGKACPDFRERSVGFKKYCKARMQIAAYVQAFNETMGTALNRGAIVVLLPSQVHYFPLDEAELLLGLTEFEKRVNLFYQKVRRGDLVLPGVTVPPGHGTAKSSAPLARSA